MSRIRFEWDIESRRISRSDGEGLRNRRQRKRRIYILLLMVFLLLAVVAACVVIVRQRLNAVESQYAQLLQDTVKAEVAALRIGDLGAFLAFQVEDERWQQAQRASFSEYGRLKENGAIDLTGNILAVTIEDERARVLVQENISDIPYTRLWFYRRDNSSWLHIAPDPAFWGDWQQYQAQRVKVNYREADSRFARQVGDNLARWLERGCKLFGCDEGLLYTVDVVLDAAESVARSEGARRHLVMRSPHTGSARADLPFDGGRQLRASQLIAEDFVNSTGESEALARGSDTRFLREAVVKWLSEHFTRIDSGALLIRSIADNYGAERIPQLLMNLSAAADMSLLERVLPVSIAQADLDWRDFIAWRLRLEDELIAARDEAAWLQLVDTRDATGRVRAYERFNAPTPPATYLASQQSLQLIDGQVTLHVTFDTAEGSAGESRTALFNLVNGVWKRAG